MPACTPRQLVSDTLRRRKDGASSDGSSGRAACQPVFRAVRTSPTTQRAVLDEHPENLLQRAARTHPIAWRSLHAVSSRHSCVDNPRATNSIHRVMSIWHPPHALDGVANRRSVPVVALTDRNEPREAVAGPVEVQHRRQPPRADGAIAERMHRHQLNWRDGNGDQGCASCGQFIHWMSLSMSSGTSSAGGGTSSTSPVAESMTSLRIADICQALATTHVGLAGHGEATHPASLPTSQAPSPRRPPPSSRKRDIPRHSKPGRRRHTRNVPTKRVRSRRLTIWVFLRPPSIRRPPAGAGPQPAWCIPLASHRLAHHSLVDACARRAPHPRLRADGRIRFAARGELEQPALAWRKGGKRDITGAQQRVPAARARGHAGC